MGFTVESLCFLPNGLSVSCFYVCIGSLQLAKIDDNNWDCSALMTYYSDTGVIYPNSVLEHAQTFGIPDIIYNCVDQQSFQSGYCGLYCIAFFHFWYNSHKTMKDLEKYTKMFSTDLSQNKRILLAYLRKNKFYA